METVTLYDVEKSLTVMLEMQFILGVSKNGRVLTVVKNLCLLSVLDPWRQVLYYLGCYWEAEAQKAT